MFYSLVYALKRMSKMLGLGQASLELRLVFMVMAGSRVLGPSSAAFPGILTGAALEAK